MSFPLIYSSNNRLSSYCDYIEYCCFTNDEIFFSEFDINDTSFTLDDIKNELERRLDLYNPFIPFNIGRRSINSRLENKDEYYHYLYCLYYANVGGQTTIENTNIFERISDVCLKNYFNTDNSIVTSVGQNTLLLIDKINSIVEDLKEDVGNFQNMPPMAKDGGIDIITYKPFDIRGNQLVCLTDATIGKNWDSQKNVFSTLQMWQDYIHFKTCPLTCLSIVHIVEPEKFHSSSRMNGMIFDRARIMKYYMDNQDVKHELINWVRRIA